MDSFVYQTYPNRVIFGSGTINQLPLELNRLGLKRPIILCTPQQTEQVETLKKILDGIFAAVFAKVVMHTPVEVTEEALLIARSTQADSVISIGGGSTIGLGKAISIRTSLYHIAIATSYAGSEATPILGETEHAEKKTRSDSRILPGTIIYDVKLTLSLPRRMTAAIGINAIAHAIEALYARDNNPITSLHGLEGIRALATSLPTLMEDPSSYAARSCALYGAWLCGTCLANVGMALHHKLCHALGGGINLPHAETNAVILPHALAFNAQTIPETMERLANVLPESNGDAIQGLNALLSKLDLDIGLRELGMLEHQIDEVADSVVSKPYWNPRPIERATIRELLRRAWAGEGASGIELA
ncbi:putative maleylacetate reductase [Fusarium oxysporum f. sp. albedinis]|nr:putative maleylacetate reductase [Fusarium oxysporum f. sp. albedinis]KAJ0139544.1 Uncharacterized protein HZ326_17537 [Fusarium oxysporum f. sp. albedinis]KAK2469291.1 hypothetical protein H9L39_19008 [Fusarium oxysporum f. sp. albedinis]